MTFILSPEIIDDIIFAMENQTEILLFDALEGICVDMDEIDDDYGTVINAITISPTGLPLKASM